MDDAAAIPDERLELIFTCCHPALALDAQVALTLRRAGRDGEARRAYRRALDLAQTEPEQRFPADRLAETEP